MNRRIRNRTYGGVRGRRGNPPPTRSPRRGRDLAQRGEAQGGQRGARSSEAKGRVPDMCNGGPYPA
jgi:hypothetical protein